MQTIDERLNLPSASSAERLVNCPGSWALEQGIKELDQTEDAASGDRVHAFLAGDKHVPLDDQEQEMVNQCERITGKLVDAYKAIGKLTDPVCVSEKRVWLFNAGKKVFSGRWDRLYYSGTFGLLIDYKTGRNDVAEADRNWQLLSLAVLASEAYDLNHVIVAIVQPWSKGQFTLAEYEASDLIKASSQLRTAIAKAQTSQERRPGKWCEWCKAKTKCAEFQGNALAVTFYQQGALTNQAILRLLDAKSQINKFYKDLESELKRRLKEDPNAIPGLRLKPGAKTREITSVKEFWKTVSEQFGPDHAEKFMSACEIGIGNAEALIKELECCSWEQATWLLNQWGKSFGWLAEGQKAEQLERV